MPSTVTPNLPWPVTQATLAEALTKAVIHNARAGTAPLPKAFSNIESIRIRYEPVIRLRDLTPTTLEVFARVITRQSQTLGPGTLINAMTNNDHAMAISHPAIGHKGPPTRWVRSHQSKCRFQPADIYPARPENPAGPRGHPHRQQHPPNAIILQLTETQPVTNTTQLEAVIKKFTQAGYSFALDDITPSTHNLLQLPFRAIKLERSIIYQRPKTLAPKPPPPPATSFSTSPPTQPRSNSPSSPKELKPQLPSNC